MAILLLEPAASDEPAADEEDEAGKLDELAEPTSDVGLLELV
mgnify:FL=1